MAIFKTNRRVEFHHTDAAGIMHFSSFFLMMEEAEHELLRSVDLSVVMCDEEERISFPRAAARCDYRQPVRFEDVVEIEVSIERLGEKSVTYGFRFDHNGKEVAKGSMTSVCCRIDVSPPESIGIPIRIAEKLRAYVE